MSFVHQNSGIIRLQVSTVLFAVQAIHNHADHHFLYFLDKNGALFDDGKKLIDDHALVALTIMIAESKPEEKEMMISVIMNCMQ